jgi:hypothetical protein
MMASNKVEVSVLGDLVNSPVIHFPGRKFPGVLIQGDSLKSMADLVNEIRQQLTAGDMEEASSVAEDLHGLLRSHLEIYQRAMESHGLELPYPSAR